MALNKKSVDDINVKGKRVLVRCDFNVPLKEGKITDETRIVAALPTIKKLLADGGKVILCSHLGKVKNGPNEGESLAPVAKRLSEKLGKEVVFVADYNVTGEAATKAVEAMKDGGELRLRLKTQGNVVYLDVRDNGPGIPQDILNRIFDPYFTTKSQGTGLGLAMVLKVTEAHGGSVRITSETEGPERGATVRFLLPATPEAVEELARREKDSSSSAVPDAVPASADVSNSSQE